MIELIFLFIVLIFLIFDGFMFYVAYRLVRPPRLVEKWTPKDVGIDYEDVELVTEDGLKLKGWWVDSGSKRTLVILHGYTTSRWAFYVKKMLEAAVNRGFNVLTFDFRAHGESEGSITTFGLQEFLDLKAALDWLEPRGDEIFLLGYSMGGIVAIRGLVEDPRPTAAVADSPPIYADRSAARGLKYFAGLPPSLYPLVKAYGILLGGRNFNLITYADRVRKPLMLIVGEEDPLVKVEEVREFYEINRRVNPDVELWVGKGGHVRIMLNEPDYEDRVLSFFESQKG